jgi:hypothetical protein
MGHASHFHSEAEEDGGSLAFEMGVAMLQHGDENVSYN